MGAVRAVRPRLKAMTVNQSGTHIVIERGALERVHLQDDTGAISALLGLLTTGEHEAAALPATLAQLGITATADEVEAVLAELDCLGLLEQADAELALDPEVLERHRSNLRFYDLFSSLERTNVDFLHAASRAHVLILGVGGVGSGVLQSLAGLAVRKVTLVDCDLVESKNLARQFLYGPESIGQRKVDCAARWMRAYAPETEVVAVHQRITDAESIVALAGDADLVVAAIDTPEGVELIVNEACFKLRVPYVLGGLRRSTLTFRSVHPGISPCRRCLALHQRDQQDGLPEAMRSEPVIDPPRVNRATGPVVQLAAGFVSLEVMRYLLEIEPPVSTASYYVLELANGMTTRQASWQHHPECELCPPKP